MHDTTEALQLILGTDKGNPCFCLYTDWAEKELPVYYGLDRKTMRKWGQALRSGDRDWLAEVLAGRWGRRKFTVEMESYVRHRWPDLRSGGQRDYRRRLQEELERVFGVRVSGATVAQAGAAGIGASAGPVPEGGGWCGGIGGSNLRFQWQRSLSFARLAQVTSSP